MYNIINCQDWYLEVNYIFLTDDYYQHLKIPKKTILHLYNSDCIGGTVYKVLQFPATPWWKYSIQMPKQ